MLKAIVGEDALPIDAKYEAVVTEQLKLKVILQLNEILAISDNLAALEARQLFLHFTQSFKGKEDCQLKTTLAGEFSGIANLFLKGLRRLKENKGIFTEPESSKELARRVRREAVPLRTFIDERCTLDPESALLIAELYAAYQEWSDENAQKPLEKTEFGKEILEVCPAVARSQNAGKYRVLPSEYGDDYLLSKRPYYYIGIRLQ